MLTNKPGFVDSHEIVVRVNNYKTSKAAGFRCDVFYSFFGSSIRKTADELKRDGVYLCMNKCPNAHAVESEWHRKNGKDIGVDYRPHYRRRQAWWFCDTMVPTVDEFLVPFNILGKHIPTTGFAAIFDVFSFNPRSVYLTGFDFFRSRIHNVNDRWAPKNLDDPFRHEPENERAWLVENMHKHPITTDAALARVLETKAAA